MEQKKNRKRGLFASMIAVASVGLFGITGAVVIANLSEPSVNLVKAESERNAVSVEADKEKKIVQEDFATDRDAQNKKKELHKITEQHESEKNEDKE